MTAPLTDYSVEAQPPREDPAQVLMILADIDALSEESQSGLDRAAALVLRAYRKLSA